MVAVTTDRGGGYIKSIFHIPFQPTDSESSLAADTKQRKAVLQWAMVRKTDSFAV